MVTVVFADLTESVRRTGSLSPEEATRLVNPLLEAMVDLMVRHGGRIDRFLGDGVLAVFGVPVAHEDDPIRAVRAAVDLRERAMSLGVSVTAGVNTGRVYFGPVGSALHEELTVMGPVVNLAARLQSSAEHDQILVGESTFAHVRAAFDLTPVELDIKGIDGLVTAFSAEGLVDHPDKVRGVEGLTAALVGREAELATLRGSLGAAASFALVGPAGLGKSRLLAELNREATRTGCLWLEGNCLQLTSHVPYAPFVDLLGRLLGSEATGSALGESVEELVASGALDNETGTEIAPYLAELVDGSGGDPSSALADSTPDQRRHLVMNALVTFLLATTEGRTAVVVIEDAHWADDSSLETIRRLVIEVGDRPIMVIATARPDDSPNPADALVPGAVLHLSELTTTESYDLIDRLLEKGALPETTEQAIIENAGGNPFYVEEILRDLIQRGILVKEGDRWRAVGPVTEVPVPESVEGLLMSRFDRLPVNVKLAARVASVLDGAFTPDLVGAMAGSERAATLPELVESGLTRRERQDTIAEYVFVHALTRQAIYSSLLPSHREELHTRAGRALENTARPDAGRLAYHYERSTDHAKAVEWMFEAARRATEAFANDIALDGLNRGIERIDQLAVDLRPRWLARYRAVRGELLERAADYEAARDDLMAALDEHDDPIEVARIWTVIGRSHRLQDDFEEAHAAYDRAEEVVAEPRQAGRVEAHRRWIDIQRERSFALYFGGRGRELPDHIERVGPVIETHGTPAQRFDHLRVRLLDEFVRTRWVLDDHCVTDARRALDIAISGADPGRIAEGYFAAGFTLLWADRVDEAAETLEQAVARTARVGDVVEECRARAYHAVALRRAGRVEEAETAAKAALEIATKLDDGYYQGHVYGVLSWVEWRRGSGRCLELGDMAYRAWGTATYEDHAGLDTEFAWIAAFPMAADAWERDEPEAAATHLRNVLVPWERPLPGDLRELVGRAGSGDVDVFGEIFDLARHYRLL